MKRYVDNGLNQNEYDSMVCYSCNSGGGLGKVAELINQDEFKGAAKLIKTYMYSRKEKVPG